VYQEVGNDKLDFEMCAVWTETPGGQGL